MRRGEILSLEWRYVDLKRRTAHLPRTKNGQHTQCRWQEYVQCKYGARPLALNKDGNAVFVKQLTDVPTVLQAFYAAAASVEFDAAIASAAKRPAKG